jgi:hypothetical protein
MTIRSTAASVFRDFITDGVPASGEHEPSKSEIRALFGAVDDGQTSSSEGILQFATWAALNAVTGSGAGQGARVFGPDASTHTDPVVGGTVANTGEYSWSASPAGWLRLGVLDISGAGASATAAAASAALAAADSVQTNLDRVATAADRVQTGLDRVATAADVAAAEADRVATAADRIQTGLDRAATAADVVSAEADRVATAADRVQTGLDRVATAADVVAATAVRVDLDAYLPFKNLFDPDDPDVTVGQFPVFSTGALSANALYTASGFVPVEASTEYTISFSHQRAFYNASKVYISGTNAGNPATFTTPAGAAFARFAILNTRFDRFQVELGPTLTDYEPYGRRVAVDTLPSGAVIPLDRMEFSIPSKNLFDKDDPDVTTGFFPAFSTGVLSANALYDATGFVPLEESTEYTITYSHQRAFYDRDKVYISGTNSGNPATFTTPAGTAFARFTILTGTADDFQVELGDTATSYQAFGSTIDSSAMIGPTLTASGALRVNPFQQRMLRKTHYKLASLDISESQRLVINCAGDSFTHNITRWVGPFVDYLVSKFGDGGGGWVGFGFAASGTTPYAVGGNQPSFKNGNARATYTMDHVGATTSLYNTAVSPDLAAAVLNASGESIVVGIPASPVHTGCTLFFIGTADGQVRWRWGAGSWTTINVQGTVGNLQTASLSSGIPSGAGTLTIEWIAGTCTLCGVNLTSTASGVVVNKIAGTGSRVGNWTAVNATQWQAGVTSLGADLFIYMDGTNTQGGGFGATSWASDVATLVGRIRAATPGVDILLMMPPENQRTDNSYPMPHYAEAGRNLALSLRTAFFDHQEAFGNAANPTEYGSAGAVPLFNADNIHPEPATGGRLLMAGALKCVLPY